MALKVALVIFKSDPARGGAERYTTDLAGALRQRGYDVSILSSDAIAPPGVPAVAMSASALTRRGKYRRFLRSVDRHLSASPYDLVHAMLPVHQCDVYHPHAGLAAEAVQHAHQRHRGGLRRLLGRIGNRLNAKRQHVAQVERRLLEGGHPPLVLCLSDYIKEEVRRHYAIDESRLVRLFNAVDLERFTPEAPHRGEAMRQRCGIPPDAVVALCLAQDFERKGVAAAIGAVARAQTQALTLLVAGRDDPEPYRRLARELGVAQRVVFAGPTDDPVGFYQAGDFFVLPTRHDPCSLVVLEALAMGLPVISTRFNGACEIMTHGEHGFVLQDPDDVCALAEAMDALCDRQRRWLMGAAVRALRPELAYEKHLEELERVYAKARRR